MMLAIDPKTRYNLKECEKRLLDLMVATPVTPPEGLQITMNPPGESLLLGRSCDNKLWYPPDG
eukprot:TRINITY_DN1843_c0_g1_i1.p3 TRINITY_DN1843_c0_g1~~TRINITY_DN1843_c0_g1_i1.p3  ORF type:complete len:63 (-),score=10.53 TRINITY_DN1843_c0_g1_i1:203-391(-)